MELPRPENPEQVERRAPARPRTRLPPRGLRLPIPPSPSPVPLPLPLPRPPPATPAAPGPDPGPGPAPALAPDDVTDPSELERLQILGYGNGGKVYKVRHRRTGAVYALKMVHGNHDEPTRRQMLREMEILRRVDSPFVVRCHGVFDCGGDIQFVLEYMDAGSLDRHHAGRPPALTEAFLAAVARQVLQGLRYLHSRRIVHRDIKPSNLLLNSRGQFKIADFGVSRILSRTLDPCNSCVGTYAYMSPERIDPDATDGRYDGYAGDIWSLGLTLLECYLGRLPLLEPGMAPDWPTLMCAICYGEPPAPPPSASPEFQSFIRCCLHKDPNQRWTASQLLSHPFLAQQ